MKNKTYNLTVHTTGVLGFTSQITAHFEYRYLTNQMVGSHGHTERPIDNMHYMS